MLTKLIKNRSKTAVLTFDAEYAWLVNASSWRVAKGYAVCTIRYGSRAVGLKSTALMHRLIMGCTHGDGLIVDHINGNTLDNRRGNLRVVSAAQNALNHSADRRELPPGVYYVARLRKYKVETSFENRRVYLGLYATPELASDAYRAWHESQGSSDYLRRLE